MQAVASEAQCTFFSLSPSQATSKYQGEGAKAIRSVFAQARLHSLLSSSWTRWTPSLGSAVTMKRMAFHAKSRRSC